MKNNGEILRILGRIEGRISGIEGRISGIEKLSERVSKLEMCQSWLKGGCAALMAAFAYIGRASFGR